MKRALVLNAVDPRIGGVLIRGERGTAKSTTARAMAALLPQIEVFSDSPFNDDPNAPNTWSDWVKEEMKTGKELIINKRQIRFVDLPVSATEDRVVGTLDIEKAIQKGERHFEPGVLPSQCGLLYIDEVNLSMITWLILPIQPLWRQHCRARGIPALPPAILVGTMNPEEGDRPQLWTALRSP
jgi:Mg-chelatase subunit ChlI